MAETHRIVCDQCPVADRAVCAALAAEDRAHLASIGRHARYRRGETIAAAGDANLVCATLVSGAAKISSIDSDGVERIVALVHPAGLLGRLFAPQMNHHVTALGDCEACLFPRDRFEQAVAERPELARRMLGEVLRELDESRALLDLIGKRQSVSRVAALLLSFARAASALPCHPADAFDLPLTRGDIAQLLGLTIETVSRQLGKLEAAGTIRREGLRRIAIIDHAALEALVA